jgi:hypothetical protein
MSKIDVSSIVRSHISTLVDYSTHRRSKGDLWLFFGLPFLISGLAVYFKWALSVDALNALLAAFAIFAGLLLNLLLLVYTFSIDGNYPAPLERVRTQFVRELHNNIAYAVLVSIVIVVVSLIAVTKIKIHEGAPATPHTGPYISSILIYLTSNFILTLLMILKRIHVMMNEKLERPSVRKVS